VLGRVLETMTTPFESPSTRLRTCLRDERFQVPFVVRLANHIAKSQVCYASLSRCSAPTPERRKNGGTPPFPRQLLHFPSAMLRTCPSTGSGHAPPVRAMESGNPSRHFSLVRGAPPGACVPGLKMMRSWRSPRLLRIALRCSAPTQKKGTWGTPPMPPRQLLHFLAGALDGGVTESTVRKSDPLSHTGRGLG
jgi:hypothetical protein